MLGHLVKEAGCLPVRVGGWIDHVHLICGLSRTVTMASMVEQVKTESSKWAKKHRLGSPAFAWQSGYAVFSVSQSNLDVVTHYANEQSTHHQKMSFQDELRSLCRKHGIELDERYVWD